MKEKVIIDILRKEEYANQKTTGNEKSRLFLCDRDNYQYCKIEFFQNGIAGTTVIPDKSDLIHKEYCFGYYLVDNSITFIDDSGIVERIFKEIKNNVYCSTEECLLLFLEYLVSGEMEFLQLYEEKMGVVEETLMNYDGENISGVILQYRKELQKLHSYYHQLFEVSEILEEQFAVFRKFTRKMERILAEIKNLREYSLQIRELYQTQIAVRQNKVMQLLTVVTAIFMPLNLLTGWYGMNFVGMKEVEWKYSYFFMIMISICLIGVEIWYFKRKKWFL